MQGVVQRPEVGVDLVVERAGQEAEPLPRFDRGPGQDDPVDLLGLQRLHRLGHREVGLAGARGPDAEHDGVLVDRLDVALLVDRLGPDGAAAVAHDVEGQHLGRPVVATADQHREAALDHLRGERLALAHQAEQRVDQAGCQSVVGGRAGQRDLVAAHVHVADQHPLDHLQQLVPAAQQRDHGHRLGHHDLRDDGVMRGQVGHVLPEFTVAAPREHRDCGRPARARGGGTPSDRHRVRC